MKESKWTHENLVFVAAGGYGREDFEAENIEVLRPYKGNSIIFRLFREVCFRVKWMPKKIWYDKKIIERNPRYINIYDPLITIDYLEWICSNFPDTQINYIYDNMVGKAKNLLPKDVPKDIRIWTYDDYDSKKYGIRLFDAYWIPPRYFRKKEKTKWDVFFVGRDKGRGEWLCDIEKKLNKMGISTNFIITKNGFLSRRKKYYKKKIPYGKVLENDSYCKAILNVGMPNQRGVTLRDIEAVAMNLKLITTNTYVVNKDFYNKNNIFILTEENLADLPDFLNRPTDRLSDILKEKHTLAVMLDEITSCD